MKTSVVLTLIGSDRPGLVGAISELVASHDGNWEQSRMAHLAGKFAGILQIALPSHGVDALVAALAGLEGRGLRIIAEVSEPNAPDTGTVVLQLDVIGHDREGIVRDISQVLAARGVNVEELATSCEAAPLAGGMLFRAHAVLCAPRAASVDDLRAALEALSDELVVELALAQGAEPTS